MQKYLIAGVLALILASPAYAQTGNTPSGTEPTRDSLNTGTRNDGVNTRDNDNDDGDERDISTTGTHIPPTTTPGAVLTTNPSNVPTTTSRAAATSVASGTTAAGTAGVVIPPNMSSQQFSTFATGRWDLNADGMISQSEWDTASPSWYGTTGTRPFATWDLNGNGTLESSEINGAFSTSRLYARYDTDNNGVISTAEADRIPR